MDSTEIHDNFGSVALRISYDKWSNSNAARHSSFRNCSFRNNLPSTGTFLGSGGAVIISESSYDTINEDRTDFINCEFHHNRTYQYPTPYNTHPAITMNENGELALVNCTFTENSSEMANDSALILLDGRLKAKIYNCIFYNNIGDDFWLFNKDTVGDYDFEAYNSLFENGLEKIKIFDTLTHVSFDETNISGDPLFTGNVNYPYSLSPGSPCINAGTLDLAPGIIIPAFDLAGNPRIYNDSIDLGAYERNEWVLVEEVLNEGYDACGDLTLFPNPFTSTTTIKIVSSINSSSELDIFTIDGRKLRSWDIEATKQDNVTEITWNGTDNQNNQIPSGYYIIRFSFSGRHIKSLGIIKY